MQTTLTNSFPSLIISIISLLVAAATLFMNLFRAAKITLYAGPTGTLGYTPGGGFGVVLPATFTNHGARLGAVLRSGVTLWKKDSPQDRYFMQWNAFVKQNFETNQWTPDEAAHTLAIQSKSIVARTILFLWLPTSQPQITFQQGTYCLSINYWTNKKNPQGRIYEIELTPDSLKLLTSESGNLTTLVVLDETITINQHLNEFGFSKLIKGE